MSLFYVYVYVLYELFIIHNVLRLCSCVFYNKLTYYYYYTTPV